MYLPLRLESSLDIAIYLTLPDISRRVQGKGESGRVQYLDSTQVSVADATVPTPATYSTASKDGHPTEFQRVRKKRCEVLAQKSPKIWDFACSEVSVRYQLFPKKVLRCVSTSAGENLRYLTRAASEEADDW